MMTLGSEKIGRVGIGQLKLATRESKHVYVVGSGVGHVETSHVVPIAELETVLSVRDPPLVILRNVTDPHTNPGLAWACKIPSQRFPLDNPDVYFTESSNCSPVLGDASCSDVNTASVVPPLSLHVNATFIRSKHDVPDSMMRTKGTLMVSGAGSEMVAGTGHCKLAISVARQAYFCSITTGQTSQVPAVFVGTS
jgi:hypothetical protein